jgi:hypothetical protein
MSKDRRNQSGSLPPFASHRTPAGAKSQEVGRGSAAAMMMLRSDDAVKPFLGARARYDCP